MSSSAVLSDTPTPTSARNGSGSSDVDRSNSGNGGKKVPAATAIDAEKEHGTHLKLTPDIKNEPPEDINDTNKDEDGRTGERQEFNNNSNSREGAGSGSGTDSPKIRLTPTNKLLASPNPVDPKRKFICPYENCTKSYGKSSHLRSHLTWHTGIKPFVCQEPNCGKGFTRSDELNRHVRTHTGEKPFECIQCTKKFSRSDHLTKHLATHAKQMQNTALKRAQQQSQSQQRIQQTNNDNDERDADIKRACAERAKILATHARQMQSMALKRVRQPNANDRHKERTKKKPYVEDVNDDDDDDDDDDDESSSERNDFEDEIPIPDHMTFSEGMHFMAALVHNPDEEPENLTDEHPMTTPGHMPIKIKLERPDNSDEYHVVRPTVASSPNKSSSSGSSTGITSRKQQQQRTNHQHRQRVTTDRQSSRTVRASESDDDFPSEMIEPVSTLFCPPSPETKTDESNNDPIMPRNHNTNPLGRRSYSNYMPERPFLCSECDKSFKRQDDLNRHVRTHTGEKPFSCNECDRRFMRSDHLKKHMKTHTKVR